MLEQVVGVSATTVVAVPACDDVGCALGVAGVVGRWPGGCGGDLARVRLQQACGDAVGEVPA
eukprot:2244036-Prymnesium_polylepis.1